LTSSGALSGSTYGGIAVELPNLGFFGTDNGAHGTEPWAFDTTRPVDGTNPYLLRDIYAGEIGSIGGE